MTRRVIADGLTGLETGPMEITRQVTPTDEAPAGFDFDVDTSVTPAGDRHASATISDRWNALGGEPNGWLPNRDSSRFSSEMGVSTFGPFCWTRCGSCDPANSVLSILNRPMRQSRLSPKGTGE